MLDYIFRKYILATEAVKKSPKSWRNSIESRCGSLLNLVYALRQEGEKETVCEVWLFNCANCGVTELNHIKHESQIAERSLNNARLFHLALRNTHIVKMSSSIRSLALATTDKSFYSAHTDVRYQEQLLKSCFDLLGALFASLSCIKVGFFNIPSEMRSRPFFIYQRCQSIETQFCTCLYGLVVGPMLGLWKRIFEFEEEAKKEGSSFSDLWTW